MTRSCNTCEWLQPPERCAESNPWQTLPGPRWCGRWRQAERLSGGVDARAPKINSDPRVPADQVWINDAATGRRLATIVNVGEPDA